MPNTILFLLPLWLMTAACATSSRDTYMEQDVGRVMETTRGTVVAAREVTIKGESSGLGAVIGGASTGVVAGSTIGSGDGSVIAGVLGGLVGMAAGYLAEDALRSRSGTEYTIQTDDGRTVTIVQNREEQALAAGTPVMVQWGTDYSRVVPLEAGLMPAGAEPRSSTGYGGSEGGSAGGGASDATVTTPASAPSGGGWINPDTLPPEQQPVTGGGAGPMYESDAQSPIGATSY